jgi:antirestriction protein ArdC
MKGYTVFNADKIDGLDAGYYAAPEPRFTASFERIEHADRFFQVIGADIRHRGARAFYAQDADYIQLPPVEAFADAEGYCATLAHEAAHWTKHPSRLDRVVGRKRWGDEGHAREELVESWQPRSFASIWRSRRRFETITPPTSTTG